MKRLVMRCGLMALLTGCTLGCGAQMGRYSLKIGVSQHDFADTIEVSYEQRQLIVPVTVGGQERRFLLDTGSAQCVVYADSPIEGTTPDGNIISFDAMGRRDTVPMVLLPPLTLGHTTFTGVQATMHRRPVGGRDYDGILGFNIVCCGLQMKIDARKEQLIISDRKNFFRNETGERLPYRLVQHVPYVEVQPFVGFREPVLIDTGNRMLFTLNKKSYDRALDEHPDDVRRQTEGTAIGRYAIGFYGSEPRGEVAFLHLDALRLGETALRQLHTLTSQGDSHLGSELLQHAALIFNPRRKQLIVQPFDGLTDINVEQPPIDKAVVNAGGRPMVGLVRPGSDVWEAGFREGDVLLSIDNKPIGSFADYVQRSYFIGHEYTFLVLRNGSLIEIKSTW